MKIPTKPLLAGMALASMLLAGATLTSTASSAASSECSIDDWDRAPASHHCSNATVTASSEADKCDVEATCSVAFQYGSPPELSSATFTPSVSVTVHHELVGNILICIAPPDDEGGYTATVRVGLCNEGEVFAAEAVGGRFVTD